MVDRGKLHQNWRRTIPICRFLCSCNYRLQDISQEVFIKVYQNLSKFKNDSKLSTWIARIAYRTALNHARKDVSNNELYDVEVLIDLDSPERLLSLKNEAEFIQRHVAQLPLAYRTVVTLYHLNEFSYQEISEITGFPEGTVKSYLFRARKLLKERLERYYKTRK